MLQTATIPDQIERGGELSRKFIAYHTRPNTSVSVTSAKHTARFDKLARLLLWEWRSMAADNAQTADSLSVDIDNLYREESFTDLRAANIKRLTPVT